MYLLRKKILAVLLIFAHITSVFGVEVSKCNMSGNVDIKIIGINFTLNTQQDACCSCEMPSQSNQEKRIVLTPFHLNIPQNNSNKNDDACIVLENAVNQGCCTVNYQKVNVPTEIYSNPTSHIKVLHIADFAVNVFPVSGLNIENSDFSAIPSLIHRHAVFGETPPIYHFCQLRL